MQDAGFTIINAELETWKQKILCIDMVSEIIHL